MFRPPLKDQQSPLWQKALENFREELAGDDDLAMILGTKGVEEVLQDAKLLQPVGSPGRKALESVNRLKPMIKFVNDFSAVLAVTFGADTAMTAVVWGSIRMILTLASSTSNTLQEVCDMLEELSLTLPRFRTYEQTLPMSQELEDSLLAVYTEVICFYARAIHFFRGHKHVHIVRNSWPELRGDFNRTIQRIRRLSSTVESEVELTRMRRDNQKYHEILELMSTIHTQKSEPEKKRYYYLPFSENSRFWGREDILSQIQSSLDVEGKATLRSFALHGMGGVGKTQVALRYANDSRSKYDAIFWLATDNLVTIGQVMLGVKDWLAETNNADDLELAKHAWPRSSSGSILVTSRDSNAAFALASDGCLVKPFEIETGSAALLNFLGADSTSNPNREEAKAITTALGGLPLALNQIGGFMVHRKVPLHKFLALYKRNAASIDSKGARNMDYSHTLATVWEMSLEKLSGNAKALHMLLSFLDPDCVQESLLREESGSIQNPELEFLQDEMEILDAEEILLQVGLVQKSEENEVLSIHRLVQTAVIRRMSAKEQQAYFGAVVDLLFPTFPDTYSADLGYQVASSSRCERSLPHLHNLVKQNEKFNVYVGNNQKFAELLLRCCWYLYEKENYNTARSYLEAAMGVFSDRGTLAYASAVELQGLIELDLGHPQLALGSLEQAHNCRVALLPADDSFLAASFVEIGLAYTEIGDLDRAHEYLQRSIDIRLEAKSERIGNSYSNMASLLLRMGKPDNAEEMLKRCPSLKDFTDDTFLKTGNPRFSGDMVLLARIRMEQGLHDDALRLASKALMFRRGCLGERLKVCDSLYQVADILQHGGNSASAIQLLTECVKISEALLESEGQRHLARALFKLSKVFESQGCIPESAEYMERAVTVKDNIYKRDGCETSTSASNFGDLVPWMLW
ncbi:uncharacterized protein CDV56_103201 [Aspergillus thermomutatus]|uniref:NB-ARC domain-containing protein n=1 Tax=Aspergillus thermomutatus TaxID=41047 RepID=A0A397G796_ASPTH|nr:uncharacterized protein CDV56_103201 [Aspergillus thermomutatus]RHZ46901.1 hypothetical protein CDV56_103201 [Aspergillus thermomutatus]